MKEGVRVLNTQNIKDIANELMTDRRSFNDHLDKVMGDTAIFGTSVSAAIGDISYGEAIEGVINFFRDEMRKAKL